jgi:hypothetical protein
MIVMKIQIFIATLFGVIFGLIEKFMQYFGFGIVMSIIILVADKFLLGGIIQPYAVDFIKDIITWMEY